MKLRVLDMTILFQKSGKWVQGSEVQDEVE